jgi:hypothetical protein
MERFGTAWEEIGQEVDRGYPEPLLDGDGPVFTATIWPHSSFAGSRRVVAGTVQHPDRTYRLFPGV